MSEQRLSDHRSRRSRIFSGLLSSVSIAGIAAAALVPIATGNGNSASAAVITGPATLAQPFSVQFQTNAVTTTDVHLLAFNDFHGNLEPAGLNIYNQYAGGSAFLAKAIKDKQKAFPAQVTVMAGDGIGASPLQSALFNEEPAIVAMNLMNVDFASVGNHEFDKGAAELKRIQAGGCKVPEGCTAAPYALANGSTTNTYPGATFKYLSANVLDSAGNTLFPAFGIKTVPAAGGGTVKIGIIGEVLKETPTIVTPSGVAGLSFVDEAAAANKAAAALKAQGVNTIVLVIHQGGFQSNPNVLSGCAGNLAGSDIERIAKAFDPSIGVIVSGHTHSEYRCSISLNGTNRLITSASSFGRILTDITLKVNPADGSLVSADATNSVVTNSSNVDRTTPRVDDPTKADPALTAMTAQYVKAAAPLANRVVGKIKGNLTRTANALGETTLGNVVADAQLASTSSAANGGAVVAFMNPGGVRADLNVADVSSGGEAPGEVTYNEMFTVQPFGNSLVTKTMTGAQLRSLLEQQFTGCGGQATTRILQISSTLSYEQIPTAATCAGRIGAIKIKGVVVQPADKFRITMNNFLATGGDGFTVFNGGTDVLGGAQDVDSFADYFKANPNGIEVPALGRITAPVVAGPGADSYSVALVGDYNYGCDLDVAPSRLNSFVQGTTLPACSGPLADDKPAPSGIQVPGRQKSNLMIADINAANVAFSIHDGDTKSGSTECRESIIDATKAQMNGLPVNGAANPGYDKPVVYTPGDNEWTDCHRFVGANKGTIEEQTTAPLKALAAIRSKMFSAPVSQGKTTMPLTTQPGYPENARWQRGPAVFATINMPGSNNNYCSLLQTNTICNQNGEGINRNTANLAWVRETFKLAKDQGLKAIVITAQANPNFERNAANDLPTYDLNGYTDFLNTMREETKKFAGQVVYVHGDSHTMRFDHPLNDTDGKPLANFTRVETAGQVDAHWIKLSVNPSPNVLLSIEPKIIAANLGNNPNRLPWFVKAMPTKLDLAPVAPANGSIGNLIWNDANNNGVKDTSEAGIAGVKVTLYDLNTPIQSGVTNANGSFNFTGLSNNDNYQVCISNPSGYLNSNGSGKLDAGQNDPTAADPNNYLDNDDNGRVTPLGHCSGYVIVNSGVSSQLANTRVGFGVFADRIIGNLVWNDANNNGLKEAAEAGLSGVKVNLYSAFTFVRSTTTDANGNYAFTGVSNFDNYQVCIENPTGYVNSTGSNKLDAGQADTTGNDPNNYVDDDDNGRTTATGHCSGFIIVSDTVPGNRRVDFGLFVPSTAAAGSFKIGNQIWNDANNNGLRESGEAGIAGATATLFLNNQSTGKTSISNTLGVYGFDGLTAGESYQVCVTLPSGMVGSNGSGKLDAGQSDLVAADPNNYVDDDDNGRTWSNGQCSGYIILSDKLASNQRVDFALFSPTGVATTTTTLASTTSTTTTTSTATTTTTAAGTSTSTTTTTAPGSSGQQPKVNEVESSGGTPGDWAELYNPGTTSTDISGWVVRDNDDTHTYTLPAGSTIPAGGYFVVEEAALTFGLGAADSVRLFNSSGTLVDSYTWTAHAATSYGRCPNGTGAFALTTTVTKGAANDCSVSTGSSTTSTTTTVIGAPTFAAWPGDSAVQTVDGQSVFGGNLSGLAFEGSGAANSGVIWGARNGPGALFRLVFNGTIWAPDTANGWSAGKLLKYKDGTGNPDAEGVTFTTSGSGGGMYVSTERNNDANSVSRNSILRVDPQSTSATLTATHEWNLTADLPTTGPNLGIEAITFVPDSFLVSKGFFDEAKNRAYNPADYPDHGSGLFFVGLEANGQIYAYALNHATEGFSRIASFASGFTGVMDLAFDRELNDLWAVCDDTCLGRSAILRVSASTGKFSVTHGFERPSGMPNINNEGFTVASQAACVNNRKPAYWADDAETGGHALRAGTVSCIAPV